MKRRIIAALMALCLCIGLLPATALAADTPSDSHYVTANYDTGALRRNITVNVYDERGTLVDTVSINDAKVAAHRITISLTEQYASEYDIEDVSHPDSAGTFTNKNVSRDSCSFDTTGAEGSNMIVSVQLCPEFEPPEIVNKHDDWYDLTLEYRLYEPQMLELLYLNGDADVNKDTTVSSIDVHFVDSYGISEDADLNSLPTGANNLPYRYMTLSDVGDKGNPDNIRYLEITYDNNDGRGEKTVKIYSGDLRYVGKKVAGFPIYEIEARDDSESIVAFYIEEGAESTTWSLYDVKFVEDGEALGYDRMPEDPTFPNTKYVFTNWDKNVTGGAPFLPYDPVTDHTVVYAQKTSTSGYGGTEYHAMNTGNALLDRFLELYNTNHNTEYGLNDIDLDSVKIQVNGLDSDATNPNYWNNHWKNNNAYYRIVNSTINLGWQSDTVSNTHVPHEQAQSITIYADVDGTSVEVVIPCGTNPGEIGKSLVQDNIVQLIVNAPPTAPDDEDLTDDPDDPDDTAILGKGAVTVDCINDKVEHDPVTYGLIPGSYTALTDEDVYWANDAEGNGAYYVDITVQDDLYVEAYNRDDDVDVTHRITGEDTKTITLKWVGSNWTVASVVPVTFTVTCDDEELPVYDITGITKELVDSDEEKATATAVGIDVVGYNYPDAESGKVIIPDEDGATVTLLYAITVTGRAGATFVVTDEDAELVEIDSVEIAVGTDTDGNATFSGTIPEGETITFYVSKTFAAEDLTAAADGEGTVLKNTATVEGTGENEEDPNNDDDTEETPAEEEDPTKPDFDADDLAGVTVQVLCVQNPTGHTYKTTLKDAPSTAYKTSIESYEGSFGEWKCTVSIDTDVFVGLFNSKAAEASWGTHAFSYATPDALVFYYTEASGWLCASDPTFTISVTEQKSQYTLTYDANGGVFFPPDELVERTTNSVTLAPGEYTLDKVAGYLEPVPYFNGQGEKVLFAGWTMKEPEEKGKVYHYNDSDIPEIEETVTITDQPVTVYAVWGYDENGDGVADVNQIVVKPADITIYMGGTGYEGTVDASGNIITSTDGAGLPEPGFIVTLPASAPANTVITDLVFEEADGGDRTWQFETYDGQADTVVYKLVPQGDEQTATRVQFTKANGEVIVSDEFTVGLEVNTSFTMALYKGSGATAVGKIVAEIDGKSYSVNSDPTGTLTVRGTTDGAQYAEMTPEETRSLPEEGKPAVMAPVGTTYAINGGEVQVQDSSGVALLFDAIIDHEDEDRTELLQDRAEAYFTTENIQPETGKEFTYEFKYLDLVDQNNGNVWVKASNDVTIYWPLPEGADTNTLKVLHFKDLHREMATADIESQIEQCDVEAIDVEVVGSHVTFKIGSSGFSPFALVWQEKDGTTPAQYTVTYHENFGSSTDTRQNDFAAGTQVTVITNPFGGHSNYAFDGWNTRADGNGTSYDPGDPLTVTGNITLYAQWRYTGGGEYNPKDATLRFNSRGGTEFDDIVRNDPFEYNPYNKIPSRPGYRFTGWYDSSRLDNRYDEDEEISVPMGITTVFAGWEETSVPSMLNGDDHYAYIQGYSDGTVRPNANITRAQVATIFFRLLDEDVRDDNLTTYNTFPDVDEDYWANTAISTMASLGVINGRNSGLFDPDAYITRAEFAAICARFDDSGVDGITTFTDTVGHWAEDEISRAAALGWIQGYSDGTFRPNQYITRAQAVTMINRVLCRLPEDTDDLLSGMNTWTDCHEDDWFYLAIQEATNSHDFVAKDRVYESWTDLNRAPDWSRYE